MLEMMTSSVNCKKSQKWDCNYKVSFEMTSTVAPRDSVSVLHGKGQNTTRQVSTALNEISDPLEYDR
jgi:hypothetical protein